MRSDIKNELIKSSLIESEPEYEKGNFISHKELTQQLKRGKHSSYL
jgi:hypothetical protein